jgi:hypothetical protein
MTAPAAGPDLTQRPPRSPRVRLGGYVLLPRLLDKARAAQAGVLGEYRFTGKGMDRHFFTFTGLTFDVFKAEVATGKGDGAILAWVQASAPLPRQPWEIEAWSSYLERRTPDGDTETLTHFTEAVGQFAKDREDIHTWFDYLDLDDHCTFGGTA